MKARLTPQIVLTKEQAIEIFLIKYTLSHKSSLTAKSTALADKFKVSAKTVRDIWCGRSWLDATYDLWQEVMSSTLDLHTPPPNAKSPTCPTITNLLIHRHDTSHPQPSRERAGSCKPSLRTFCAFSHSLTPSLLPQAEYFLHFFAHRFPPSPGRPSQPPRPPPQRPPQGLQGPRPPHREATRFDQWSNRADQRPAERRRRQPAGGLAAAGCGGGGRRGACGRRGQGRGGFRPLGPTRVRGPRGRGRHRGRRWRRSGRRS
jgi:hypothetical protein